MPKHVRSCADCGCRLSLYNNDVLCSTCAREAHLRVLSGPQVPDVVWRDNEVQAAIAACDFGRASRLIRARSGLRQGDMATLTGLSQGFLSMLESGARRLTNLDRVARFLQGIGAPDALLPSPLREHVAQSFLETLPVPESAPVSLPWTDDGRESDLQDLAAQAAAQSLRFAEATLRSNVTEASLEGLALKIATIATDYVHTPLHPLFTDLLSTRDHIFSLLGGRQPPRQTRDLYLLAGTSCLLLAHASQNLGDRDAAMAQIQTSWTFAEQADHNDLKAWTKGTAALIAEWSPQQRMALEYTRQAAEFSPVGETRIRMAAIEARAAARIGDRDRALSALHALQEAREQQTPAGDLGQFGGILTFPNAKQEYYIGGTYALLGENALAEQHATEAIAIYENGPKEARSYGDEALAHLDVVTARIAGGELEGADEHLQPILELPQDLRIRQIDHAVHRVATLLEAPRLARSRTARQLADAARSYQSIDTTPKAALK
ncbi:helix-turn-helix domain-containing protein [Streptomyces sp. NPDC096339]|uniref:helix-turn-helix domain-containing protein n=1 Tax=Streptomyces sp. NPDC096339 TaxID=3366086 RepID=UPI0037F6B9C7